MNQPISLSGEPRLEFCQRLLDSWEALADILEIKPYEQVHFREQGDPPRRLLEWLECRQRLDELPVALEKIRRHDLIPLLRTDKPPKFCWSGNPYKGLRRYNPEDAPIFFGRESKSRLLQEYLRTPDKRFIAVVGASGSGKSSLVAAGVLPWWRERQSPELELRPSRMGGRPLSAFFYEFSRRLDRPEEELRERWEESRERMLHEVMDEFLANIGDGSELLIFVDQFEELFTAVKESEEQEGFANLLTAASRVPGLRVVVAMRADFFPRALAYQPLYRMLEEGSFPLGPPGVGSLYEMVTLPARARGITFEDGLEKRILDDTGSSPGALALMAFALDRLYRQVEKALQPRFSHAVYETIGQVQGAIGRQAEDAFEKLPGGAIRDAFGRVFRELVSVDGAGEQGAVTRQRVAQACFAGDAAAEGLIQAFVDQRLLVSTSDRETGEPMLEVAHEALFSHWPKLQAWIETTREDRWRWHECQLAVAAWEKSGRNERLLWPHERVKEMIPVRDNLAVSFDESEVEFLGPLDADEAIAELDDLDLPHERRLYIGDRLAMLGDPRPGVGLKNGVPDIVWCRVETGTVELEDGMGTHEVESFWISRFPVTWLQYRVFVEADDGWHDDRWWGDLDRYWDDPPRQFHRWDNRPADSVSWFDVVAFCRWLSVKLGFEVRLPTEMQWQLAATGGDRTLKYPWPGGWDSRRANTYEVGPAQSTAVGMYPGGVSPVGAMDMAGNVWEWCLNEFDDLAKIELTSEGRRVCRGGSWGGDSIDARAAYRDRLHPDNRGGGRGDRVVCSAPIHS